MNRPALLNHFKRGLDDLLAVCERELARPTRDPYTESDPNRRPHEHDTRLIFVDELLGLLGWRLGHGGNVLEEARLQTGTTKFMDYVGVVDLAGTPLLLVEAKAWDKPAISERRQSQHSSKAELLVAAIEHIREGKSEETSPIIAEWDGYLRQIGEYVKTLKERYHHDLPRAVIVSGEWMVVFRAPFETFLGSLRSNDIAIFTRTQFRERAGELFALLHRSTLAEDAPMPLRPAQLRQFIELSEVFGAFHGVHVCYERTGSKLFARRPRILVYPALFVVRRDDVILTVIDSDTPVELDYQDVDGVETLTPHLDEIHSRSEALITACGNELGGVLSAAKLSTFPGFPDQGTARTPVRDFTEPDVWLVATGSDSHFLLAEPRVQECRFHTWAECGAHAAVPSATSAPTVSPPAYFVDTQRHHCAHQVVQDRRSKRCLIQAIESRLCCQVCAFLELCWSEQERAELPCGR